MNKIKEDALNLAASRDSLDVLKIIVEKLGESILFEYREGGLTSLLASVIGAAKFSLTWLLQKKQGLHYACSPLSEMNGLMFASINNHISIMQEPCDAGLPLEARNFKNRTAIMESSLNGKLEAFQWLYKRKAEISVTDSGGWDTITLASNKNHVFIVENFPQYLTSRNFDRLFQVRLSHNK